MIGLGEANPPQKEHDKVTVNRKQLLQILLQIENAIAEIRELKNQTKTHRA